MSQLYDPDFSRIHKMDSYGKDGSSNPDKPGLQFRSPHLNNLKIDVPACDFDSANSLGDAFEFDSFQSPSVGYHNITKLPTPVMTNGPFPKTTIEIKKRNAPDERRKTEKFRVASEYESDRSFRNRLSSVELMPPSVTSSVRHSSIPDSVGGHEGALISPISDFETESLQSSTFHASRLDRTYRYSSIFGSGAFSVVVAASNVEEPHEMVAIKIISVPHDDASNFRRYITRELGILSHLDHPCIVKLLDYNLTMSITQAEINNSFTHSYEPCEAETARFLSADDNRQLFYLNFCAGGNLFSWLERNWLLGSSSCQFWRFLIRIVSEILMTVAYLHGKRIVHRDIKLENVLINKDISNILNYETDLTWGDDAVSTITDFGLSKRLESDKQLLTTKCGSQDYVSPELLMGLKYDGKLLDAWSIGVLVYSMLENRLPFDPAPAAFDNSSGISPSVLRRRRSKNKPAHRIAMVDWEWYRVTQMLSDENMSKDAKQIISNMKLLVECLLVRKENRMLIEAVVKDSRFTWIQDYLPDVLCCVD